MKTKQKGSFFERLSAFIVGKRSIIFLVYIAALVFSLFSLSWVEIENDVTNYLGEDTEIRQGLQAMTGNFTVYSMAQVMVKNVTYEKAVELSQEIAKIDGITAVMIPNDEQHYKDACALMDVNFAGTDSSQISKDALAQIRATIADYDHYINTTIGQDMNAMLAEEMLVIFIVASVIILVVLTLTSRSYAEVAVLLLNFCAAAVLNLGTHFLCGKISFISNSVAVVLQLALAIDYAIILCHRYCDEREYLPAREAVTAALSKAIPEIGASSLTTISGLIALGFMGFKIGLDMSIVLIKSIILSLLTVFILMPGLLLLFAPLMDKTRHKKLLPNMSFLGKFAVKTRRVLPILFILLLGGAFYLSSNCPFTYSMNDIKTTKMSEEQVAYFEIKDTFGTNNMVALVVPVGDYQAEAAILEELSQYPQVKSTMGLASIEAIGGYRLGDALNPRQFSELIGLDYEVALALYTLHAAEFSQYGDILAGMNEYSVPLFDMFMFLKEQLESANISLSGIAGDEMGSMLDQLNMAKEQMQSAEYSRMVVYLNLPEEGEETYAFLQTIRDITGKYYDGDYYVVGNSTSSRDLAASFERDNLLISILSAVFVIIVLLFTFQSVGLSVLLIIVIQGSIWINFSYPTLIHQPLYFLGYMIVQALQMGANIDYAIVISSHYQEQKKFMPHKEAIEHAMNSAFPTVFTSGTIMASAGILIGNMSAQPVVSIMGMCIGRGTVISMILVLLVLPSILVLGDSIISRTKFHLPLPEPRQKEAEGLVYVNGRLRGFVSGNLDGEFTGVIRGKVDANVSTETDLTIQELDTPEYVENPEGGEEHD